MYTPPRNPPEKSSRSDIIEYIVTMVLAAVVLSLFSYAAHLSPSQWADLLQSLRRMLP
jgi:hypothetical protein